MIECFAYVGKNAIGVSSVGVSGVVTNSFT